MQIRVNGISVNIYGLKTNPAIIFVHGFPYDHNMWENQIKRFKKDYYCVAYDIRGLGKSAVGCGQFTMELFADDLFDIIKKLKIKKPVLVGLSMGGYLALRAAERNQELFAGFVFADTHPRADDNVSKLKRSSAIAEIESKGLKRYAKNFLPLCFLPDSNRKRYYSEALRRATKQNPKGVKGAQLAMLSRTSTEEFLPEIKKPTLVIVGREDKLTPPQVMKEMAAKIPGAEFVVVPNAAHMSPVENPEVFNAALENFLKQVER